MALAPAQTRRRGSTLPLFALAMVVIMAVAAVAIDLSRAYSVQIELHNAAEASAHAAALALDGTAEGLEVAELRAVQLAGMHEAGATDVDLTEIGELQLGYMSGGAFVADTSTPSRVTAARVALRLPDMRTFFSLPAFGTQGTAVSAAATAVGGGPVSSPCPFPIAIPSCGLPTDSDGNICNVSVVFGPDNNDNGAWARIGTTQPNASWIKSSLESCSAASDVGDIVSLNNGQIASAAKAIADAIDESEFTWDATEWGSQPAQLSGSAVTNYGNVLESQIMVFEDPGNCASPKMTGEYDIAGYATAVLYDAISTGAASNRKITMRIVCETTTEQAGGAFYGTRVPPQFQ